MGLGDVGAGGTWFLCYVGYLDIYVDWNGDYIVGVVGILVFGRYYEVLWTRHGYYYWCCCYCCGDVVDVVLEIVIVVG